ncbi:NCAIR mutase (PurE)-related protein [Longilinea arvoryzae]|uniref:NCAIR mutase (PurE)-related protein n=1 Tax=Longilinea arvoryzae TaxID=360412 RepID=A0A0S7BPF8_9CHLR|nr:nickel pincer cofactor biosynthesis protein LarB [Longilinea arvoryzae]GAP15841.1 NCAIR mutase (PurE)-related protein [Longilinea arvoryzae]
MNETELKQLLEAVQAGQVPVNEAVDQLRRLPYEAVGDFALLDNHRDLRCGFPEVVFAQGKAPDQILAITNRLAEHSRQVLVTRLDAEVYEQIRAELPADMVYHARARVAALNRDADRLKHPGVLVLTAGTADIPVAEEAALTAELMGHAVERVFDVGVSGLHRLLNRMEALRRARVIVVVAGMEGALASVVGGLVSAPVIAVPTSVGYGASFNGLAALLAMLNSCAKGVAVVNIDNGFGAGTLAAMINAQRFEEK